MASSPATNGIASHPVVADEQWLEARRKLLAREKELTHLHDQVARERRALPWRRVATDYVFDTTAGRRERDVPHKMEWVRHHDRYEAAPRSAQFDR